VFKLCVLNYTSLFPPYIWGPMHYVYCALSCNIPHLCCRWLLSLLNGKGVAAGQERNDCLKLLCGQSLQACEQLGLLGGTDQIDERGRLGTQVQDSSLEVLIDGKGQLMSLSRARIGEYECAWRTEHHSRVSIRSCFTVSWHVVPSSHPRV